MAYSKKRVIRISSSIIGGKRMSITTDAATGEELKAALSTFDHEEYGTQDINWNKHALQMTHLNHPQGTAVTAKTVLPETGTLAIAITPSDNKNG